MPENLCQESEKYKKKGPIQVIFLGIIHTDIVDLSNSNFERYMYFICFVSVFSSLIVDSLWVIFQFDDKSKCPRNIHECETGQHSDSFAKYLMVGIVTQYKMSSTLDGVAEVVWRGNVVYHSCFNGKHLKLQICQEQGSKTCQSQGSLLVVDYHNIKP